MSWTQTDIDALKAALGTGALKVRYADGREVTYRTLDEMERLLTRMTAAVSPAAGGWKRRQRTPAFRNGF